jgi:hypothetical protein
MPENISSFFEFRQNFKKSDSSQGTIRKVPRYDVNCDLDLTDASGWLKS